MINVFIGYDSKEKAAFSTLSYSYYILIKTAISMSGSKAEGSEVSSERHTDEPQVNEGLERRRLTSGTHGEFTVDADEPRQLWPKGQRSSSSKQEEQRGARIVCS